MTNVEKNRQEADGNPETVLEDTAAHERIGFRQNDSINSGVNMSNTVDKQNKTMEDKRKSP